MMAISPFVTWYKSLPRWTLLRIALPLAWRSSWLPYNDVDALRQLAERCDV